MSFKENAVSDDPRGYDPDDESFDCDDPDELDSDDDLTETVPCPECGAEVYEEAEQCPRCGSYITHGGSVWAGRPIWWIVLGLLGLVAGVLALAGWLP
jgi:hypothetical protein